MIKKREKIFFIKPLSPVKLKLACITLGASFIKLAQVLATRADFFTEDYLEHLKDLHDQLPVMKKKDFEAVFKRSFQNDPFKKFHNTPIASASIGQVHIAYLEDDTKVAVKLRRVGIKEQVYADIAIISFFNKLFRPLFSHHTKNSIEAVIEEFAKMIKQEVSLTNELNNLLKFSEIYKNSGVKFPIAYPQYCCDEVIVMSFEEGFRFDDKKSLFKHKIDFKKTIATLVDFYTTQMLINGYFHADPHPGNLLVNTKGELILLDFGMVKTVPNDTRIAIIELIKAANEQDYDAYISANKRLGTIAYEAPTSQLAEFTQKMFEIFSNDNLSSESMQKLAFEVLESARDFPFKLPSDAIYILRVSAIIEGLGTTYIENFNGIKDILPILQTNIPKALGAKETISETLLDEIKDIPFTLKHLKSSLKQISEGEVSVNISNSQLHWVAKELKEYIKPKINGFAFMIAGFFILLFNSSYDIFAAIFFSIGFLRVLISNK